MQSSFSDLKIGQWVRNDQPTLGWATSLHTKFGSICPQPHRDRTHRGIMQTLTHKWQETNMFGLGFI